MISIIFYEYVISLYTDENRTRHLYKTNYKIFYINKFTLYVK
jgi:hypothetical protein